MRRARGSGRRRSGMDGHDGLELLLADLSEAVLRELVLRLCDAHPETRRECLDFLQRGKVAEKDQALLDGELVFSLWQQLEPDLEELDAYGGGDEGKGEDVAESLSGICDCLSRGNVRQDRRMTLLGDVLKYISSGNSGLEDSLYDVAYATCYNDSDLRTLAKSLLNLGKDWPREHAMRIYRRIGDKEDYLALRARQLEYGSDYYDLATFHWESGQPEKALEVARDGARKATGRMVELREFLAARALESGDRHGYLDIQFEQTLDQLDIRNYKAFRKACTDEEWATYQPAILAALNEADLCVRLDIYMARREFARVADLLSTMRPPDDEWESGHLFKAAQRLERRFPDQIMAFYMKGLSRLGQLGSRSFYSRLAKRVLRVRRMWLDVYKAPEKWDAFKREVKLANQRRPAFEEEFGRTIPDWRI